VWSPKKLNVHLCQKVPFVLACFQAPPAPRPQNPDNKDALFDLDTQITYYHIDCSGEMIFGNFVDSGKVQRRVFFDNNTFRIGSVGANKHVHDLKRNFF
jgi:hypothetical protein